MKIRRVAFGICFNLATSLRMSACTERALPARAEMATVREGLHAINQLSRYDSVCRNGGSARKIQMNVFIQKLDGLWHLVVGSCQIRAPFLETQDREWVVAYARRIYPGAKVFERD